MKQDTLWHTRLLRTAIIVAPILCASAGCDEEDGENTTQDSGAAQLDGGGGDGPGDAGHDAGGSNSGEACTYDECQGPAPGAPNYVCDDGTTGGPMCAKDHTDTCVWQFRECKQAEACGGISGAGCPEDSLFCDFELGTGCRAANGDEIADASGFCTATPALCTREYKPVCGCDGTTYSNRCSAHAAGVAVASEGTCPAP